jgi:hypothetical protein
LRSRPLCIKELEDSLEIKGFDDQQFGTKNPGVRVAPKTNIFENPGTRGTAFKQEIQNARLGKVMRGAKTAGMIGLGAAITHRMLFGGEEEEQPGNENTNQEHKGIVLDATSPEYVDQIQKIQNIQEEMGSKQKKSKDVSYTKEQTLLRRSSKIRKGFTKEAEGFSTILRPIKERAGKGLRTLMKNDETIINFAREREDDNDKIVKGIIDPKTEYMRPAPTQGSQENFVPGPFGKKSQDTLNHPDPSDPRITGDETHPLANRPHPFDAPADIKSRQLTPGNESLPKLLETPDRSERAFREKVNNDFDEVSRKLDMPGNVASKPTSTRTDPFAAISDKKDEVKTPEENKAQKKAEEVAEDRQELETQHRIKSEQDRVESGPGGPTVPNNPDKEDQVEN